MESWKIERGGKQEVISHVLASALGWFLGEMVWTLFDGEEKIKHYLNKFKDVGDK